ncbi:unnamed protein product [Chrysodeixis includens]|uniref:Uncharacterized protein n=1 Tax=Chrysodeixis includens TaxID=689277 RepID=A0A9N8PXP5_CHRIL|nr:unnamed protein product [Chrysodeixis includens]
MTPAMCTPRRQRCTAPQPPRCCLTPRLAAHRTDAAVAGDQSLQITHDTRQQAMVVGHHQLKRDVESATTCPRHIELNRTLQITPYVKRTPTAKYCVDVNLLKLTSYLGVVVVPTSIVATSGGSLRPASGAVAGGGGGAERACRPPIHLAADMFTSCSPPSPVPARTSPPLPSALWLLIALRGRRTPLLSTLASAIFIVICTDDPHPPAPSDPSPRTPCPRDPRPSPCAPRPAPPPRGFRIDARNVGCVSVRAVGGRSLATPTTAH